MPNGRKRRRLDHGKSQASKRWKKATIAAREERTQLHLRHLVKLEETRHLVDSILGEKSERG